MEVVGGQGSKDSESCTVLVVVTVGDTAVCFDEGRGLVQAPDQRRSCMKVVAVAGKTDGDGKEGRLADEAGNASISSQEAEEELSKGVHSNETRCEDSEDQVRDGEDQKGEL